MNADAFGVSIFLGTGQCPSLQRVTGLPLRRSASGSYVRWTMEVPCQQPDHAMER